MAEKIFQGKIANHDQETFLGQIVIDTENGLIKEVINLENTEKKYQADRIFADNCVIFPGMTDVHIHAREDQTGEQLYKEEYETAGNAALNGGVCCTYAMPNTPKPVTTIEDYRWHRQRLKTLAHPVTTLNYVGIGPETTPITDDQGKKVAYKMYMGPSVGDLFFRSAEEIDKALSKYQGENVSFHVEDFLVLEESKQGKTHQERRPVECVEVALDYLLPMIEKYEINAKLCHWSINHTSFNKIRAHRQRMAAKNLGYNTTIEVSPEHLIFDSDMCAEKPELWPYIQMNPSIQGAAHRKALIAGLKEGFIDYIATDHAPHTLEEKFKNFAAYQDQYPSAQTNEEIYLQMLKDNPKKCRKISCENGVSGVPWLDVYGLVVVHLLHEHQFTLQELARCTAYNPGLFIKDYLDAGYGKGFGKIEAGYYGALTVIDLETPLTLKREMIKSKAGWSALEGRPFKGQVKSVIIRGQEY